MPIPIDQVVKEVVMNWKEWVTLSVAIGLINLASIGQIIQEWKIRGLTHTSYKILFLQLAGNGMLIYLAVHERLGGRYVWWAAGIPAVAVILMIWIKVRDRIRQILRRF